MAFPQVRRCGQGACPRSRMGSAWPRRDAPASLGGRLLPATLPTVLPKLRTREGRIVRGGLCTAALNGLANSSNRWARGLRRSPRQAREAQAPSPSRTEETYVFGALYRPVLPRNRLRSATIHRAGREAEMTVQAETMPARADGAPSFGEAFRVWLKIGCINFGGPAGQIAMMHRMLVDEKKWIDEPRFLHALNFCMLLPGPGGAEARDLRRLGAAWRARRARGRHPVRAAGRAGDAGLEPCLCARARHRLDRRRAVRHQGGGAGDRGRGAAAHRQARAEDAAADRARGRGVHRHLLPQRAVPADRRRRGADRLSGGAHGAGADGPEAGSDRHCAGAARPLAAVLPGGPRRPHRLVGAGRARRARARARPRAGQHRDVLLQARGGELRRCLRAARLHGAAGGRDASLDDRARNGRWARTRRDHARAADPGDAVRRFPRGVPRRGAVLAGRRPASSAPP